ncbi:hypothetical protein LPJ74_002389 [Coemansia sp. RSA 1843]|nr:hypothetical protein LPJ74_002389 [Coemansia sp. RSA 1843]
MGNDEKGNNFLGSAQLDDPYIARIIDESSVDFARKQMDKRIEKLTQNSGSQASLDSPTSSDRAYSSSLVEIIDEFGRSRMVPRSKAKYYHSKDYETSSDSDSANDIRFDENDRWSHRDRGTSHYNLASDSIKRDEQLDTLRELHEETLKARETSSNVVDMQQTMLSARREQIRTSRKRTTYSSLLSFLSRINESTTAGAEASASPASSTLNFSSLLPTSGSVAGTNTNTSLAPAPTALPIDADIDQLMKSLGDSVDTSKVSNEDIDKLLGSLNVNFPPGMALPGTSTSRAADVDPLASLGRDLGIDLSTSVSLPPTNATMESNAALRGPGVLGTSTNSAFTAATAPSQSKIAADTHGQQQSFVSQQDMNTLHSDPMMRTQVHSGFHMSSMPASPALSGTSGSTGMQRQGPLSQLQQGMHYRPPTPRAQQQSGNMQQRTLTASQSPSQVGSKQAATSHAPPAAAAGQHPPRPQTPLQVNRSGSKQRMSFSDVTSSPGLSASQPSNPGSRAESPSTQVRPPRQLSAQQSQSDQTYQGQHGMQQTGGPAGMHMRPQQRPQAAFGSGSGPGSVDPSRWLVDTMSKLPAAQQERLAGLFRGLQSKTIDFQTFMRDAKVIMGSKFQDLLVLMHNQGPRPLNMSAIQQQQQQPGGPMQQQASGSMARPNSHFSMMNARPGMPLMSAASPPMPISQGTQRSALQHNPLATQGNVSGQHATDGGRNNIALIRQFLASQQGNSTSSESSGSTMAVGDSLPLSLPTSAYQNGQAAMTAMAVAGTSNQDASIGNFPVANMGSINPETLIARWRQIILNPTIPAEQLARLSMQLSSFGNLIASNTGPMAHLPEEARNQQFVQITKLQALIAQRQFTRGSQAQTPINSQPASRPDSPKPEKKPKDMKNKAGSKPSKDGSTPTRPKKRVPEARGSGSPAPRPSSKKQKTIANVQTGTDMDTLATRLALAGPSLSLDNISSISAAGGSFGNGGNAALVAGLTAPQNDGKGTPTSYVDADSDEENGSSVDYEDEDDTPISASLVRGGISRTESLDTGAYNSEAEQDFATKGKDRQRSKVKEKAGDKPRGIYASKEKTGSRDTQRKPKEKREKDRGGAGGGDVFSIDDVIGYTGVDLREESEISLGSMHHRQGAYGARGIDAGDEDGPVSSTRIVNGVEVSRDRSLGTGIANSEMLEVLVSRICKRLNIRAVSADAVPYLSLALQERLRSFMEIVSAAAYHRTRTQTLPPPPLDPNTRLPLYKITPHLDVKKQLVVLERMDKMREQSRQRLLKEREQSNTMDPQQQANGEEDGNQAGDADERKRVASSGVDQTGSGNVSGTAAGPVAAELVSASGNNGTEQLSWQSASSDAGDALKTAATAKRGRKRDDGASESPAYTSKNMPEDIRNKISNQTALRAAGGIRKSWMNASSADWLGGASAGKANTRPAGAGSQTTQQQQQQQQQTDAPDPSASTMSQAGDSLRSGSDMPTPHPGHHLPAKRTASIGNMASFIDTGAGVARPSLGHRRNRSSASNTSDFDNIAVVSPAPDGAQTPLVQSASLRPPSALLPHRSTALSAPLLVTVRDCLFSLERERLGSARAGRGSGDRVLIQAYSRYIHD